VSGSGAGDAARGKAQDAAGDRGALAGKPVVVTGGASGIGLACALACARAGAHVLLVGLPAPELAGAAQQLHELGLDASTAAADVRDFDALQSALVRAGEELGPPAAVVASAGIADQSSVLSGEPSRWRAVIETNLVGAANTIRAAGPLMAEAGRGDVVLIASMSGRQSYVGEPAYIASKWGVVGLGHAARRELEPLGVRLSLVEPGLVDTPLTRSSPRVRRLLERAPSLHPDDVAEAVLWILLRPRHVSVSELSILPLGQGDVVLDDAPSPDGGAG
jgi:ribitol 2-dehydrogenase